MAKTKEAAKNNNSNNPKKNLIIFSLSVIIIIALIAAFFYFNNKSPETIENIENSSQNNTNNTIETLEVCTESWKCEGWSVCNGNYSERSCVDENNCSTTKNKPEVKKDCCFWNCTEWSQCLASNTSFRTCNLPKECNITEKKPDTRVNCTYENLCTDDEGKVDYEKIGKVTDKNGAEWYDICLDDRILSEVYCGSNGDVIWKEYTCNATCEDGECN